MKQVPIGKYIESYIQRATSLRFQIVLSIITSTVLTLLLYNSFYNFRTFDPAPELYPYTKEQLAQNPTKIETGLLINSFLTFNPTKNTFIMDCVVWFKFNPKKITLDKINKFSFEKATILKKGEPDIINQSDTVTLVKYPMQVKFTSDLDYRFFPFDDHRISILLTNHTIELDKYIFTSQPNNFQLEDNLHTGGLSIFNTDAKYGFSESQLIADDPTSVTKNPRVIFSLDFRKYGLRRMILIIIPIILIFFIAIFSLSLDPSRHVRDIMTLSVGSITSLLTYRFVIESLSPPIDYFTLTDYLYTFVLVCTFFVFLFGAFSIRTKELSYTIKIIRVTAILCLHISLIVFVYFLLN